MNCDNMDEPFRTKQILRAKKTEEVDSKVLTPFGNKKCADFFLLHFINNIA